MRTESGGIRLNSTRVLSDGTWTMDVTLTQLNSNQATQIYFEMDGQDSSSQHTITLLPRLKAVFR